MQVPSNPAARLEMEERIRALEKENAVLQSRLKGDFFHVHTEAFASASGFRDADHALRELQESGCCERLKQMDRHRAVPPVAHYEQARDILLKALPGLEAAVRKAYEHESKKVARVGPKAKQGRKAVVDERHLFLLPFLYIFGGLFEWAGHFLPMEKIAFVINELVSFGFCVGLFVALMRMSTGPKPSLRYLVMGAAVGAILFALGKHLMALYLSTAAVVSAYGAAGSLVVILMWIYFSSAVLLLSASVARAWADEAEITHATV